MRVLVVDDEEPILRTLSTFLGRHNYEIATAPNGADGIKKISAFNPDIVLLDLAMPGMDGLETMERMKQLRPDVSVLIVAGQGKPEVVFRASKLGAEDFITKPFELKELEIRLQKVVERRRLLSEVAELRRQVQGEHTFLGNSPAMEEVRRMIERVADTDVTVLIRGESGTGKEVVARTICSVGDRRSKPFVKVNCAAIPHELLESELFGYEAGAFTGAGRQKIGKFELANHGTILLDEISEMHPALQAKLLHVLQDGEFARLGGKHNISVSVRVLAATNVNLELAVAEGRFREDLFYRLNVVVIEIPPLRRRAEEIPLLINFFRAKYSAYYGRETEPFSDLAMQRLLEYPWPGNVRELENLVKRYVIMGNEDSVLREISSRPRASQFAPLSESRPPDSRFSGSSLSDPKLSDPRFSDPRFTDQSLSPFGPAASGPAMPGSSSQFASRTGAAAAGSGSYQQSPAGSRKPGTATGFGMPASGIPAEEMPSTGMPAAPRDLQDSSARGNPAPAQGYGLFDPYQHPQTPGAPGRAVNGPGQTPAGGNPPTAAYPGGPGFGLPSGFADPSVGGYTAAAHSNLSLLEIGRQAARRAEREAILATLEQTRWNRRQAAKLLRISYKALHNKLKLIYQSDNLSAAESDLPDDPDNNSSGTIPE
jgi:two-component system response regulator AtoC